MQVIHCWRTFSNYFIIYSFNVSSQDFMRTRREKRKTTGTYNACEVHCLSPVLYTPTHMCTHARTYTHTKKFLRKI